MDNSYIVAYEGGSSGRFIGYMLWALLSNSTEDFQITEENSAHFYDFALGVDFNDVSSNASNVYEEITFRDDVSFKILRTHTFPKIDIISKKFPNTKIIVISFTEKDAMEVMGNTVYKNWLSETSLNDPKSKPTLEKNIRRVFKRNILKENLTLDQIRMIIEDLVYWDVLQTTHLEYISPFLNPTISHPNILIIPYHELYLKNDDGEYVVLKKLEDLTNTKANIITQKNYEKYVKGRDIFIAKKMPWLLKNDTEKPNN